MDKNNTQYFIITSQDIIFNGIAVKACNNMLIQNYPMVLSYFNAAKMFFFKEFGLIVKEFHLMQALNSTRIPIPDLNGNFSWERILIDNNIVSDWVVTDFYSIPKYCSANMFCDSANLSRTNSAFRLGLAKTLPTEKNILHLNS